MSAAALLLALALAGGQADPAAAAPAPPQSPPPPAASAPPPEPRNAVSLRLENDIIAGTDQDYTSGFSLALSREGPGLLGGFWNWVGAGGGRLISTYELAQMISTPSDIKRRVPDPNDRPYAGVLFGALTTQAVNGTRLDGLKLLAGVVGPVSLAEPVQKAIHAMTGSLQARGWKYQLRNELLLNVFYEQRRRYTLLTTDRGWGVQVIPRAGASLGNLLIQAQAEGHVRFGRHLPDNFGTSLSRGLGNAPFPAPRRSVGEAPRSGAYVFAGGGAYFVRRNLVLDGNTLGDSPGVNKHPVVGSGEAGFSFWTGRVEVTASFVYWTREHEGQRRPGRFGTAVVAFSF